MTNLKKMWNDPELQKHITNIKTKMEKIINNGCLIFGVKLGIVMTDIFTI